MLTGRALRRRAYVAAAIPPVLALHDRLVHTTVAQLAAELHQPERIVHDACIALETEGWVTITANGKSPRIELTPQATRTMDAWETEMAGSLG